MKENIESQRNVKNRLVIDKNVGFKRPSPYPRTKIQNMYIIESTTIFIIDST